MMAVAPLPHGSACGWLVRAHREVGQPPWRTAEALSDDSSMVINDIGVRITDTSYLDAVAHPNTSGFADMADASCANFKELQDD